MKRILVLSLIILIPISIAKAEMVEEDPLETKTRAVAKTLRCAVCQSESIWESNATLAKQMREIIRERLTQGQSAEEIQAYFVSRYGDYILLQPRKRGLNWILWVGPFVLLLIGSVFLYRSLSRWVSQTPLPGAEDLSPMNDADRSRIEKELRSLED